MSIFRLHLHYYKSRNKLYKMVMAYGLGDPKVIAQSRRVDKLANELQRRMMA